MAVAPATATPIPNPTMPCSHRGVLNTRSLPEDRHTGNHARLLLTAQAGDRREGLQGMLGTLGKLGNSRVCWDSKTAMDP